MMLLIVTGSKLREGPTGQIGVFGWNQAYTENRTVVPAHIPPVLCSILTLQKYDVNQKQRQVETIGVRFQLTVRPQLLTAIQI